jgi:integrase
MGRRKKQHPGLWCRNGIWWIERTIRAGKKKTELRESTGQTEFQLAEQVYLQRCREETERLVHGIPDVYTVGQAAAEYLVRLERKLAERYHGNEFAAERTRKAMRNAVYHLDLLMPYFEDVPIHMLHPAHEKLIAFKAARIKSCKANTVNRSLEVLRHVCRLAATEFIDEHGRRWVSYPPKIDLINNDDEANGYPLTYDLQIVLFGILPAYLQRMATFGVHAGPRERQIARLKWGWERRFPRLGKDIFCFDVPTSKNGNPVRIFLNSEAREVVNQCRGQNPDYVFTCDGRPIYQMNNTAWQNAVAKTGLRNCRGKGQHFRVHDLRVTCATRLRDLGTSLEDRKDILGHVNRDVTTGYSIAETGRLIEIVERLVGMHNRPNAYLVSHDSPTVIENRVDECCK